MSRRTILSTAFMILGVYCIVLMIPVFGQLCWLVTVLAASHMRADSGNLGFFVGSAVNLGLMGVLASMLLFRGDGIARKLVFEDESAPIEPPHGWDKSALWIGFAIGGALVLIDGFTSLTRFVITVVTPHEYEHIPGFFSRSAWSQLVTAILKVSFGAYLLVGAPGLRQHVSRKIRGLRGVGDDATPADQPGLDGTEDSPGDDITRHGRRE